MKIHRVRADVNNYQYFMLEDPSIGLTDLMTFDGTPKVDNWVAPVVYVQKPKLKRGNFPDLWATATLVVDEAALEQLRDLLEMSCELLPLRHEGKLYHVLNVMECVNLIDDQKTQWLYEKGSGPIKKYAFHAARLTESPLFKIPETCKSEILTCEGLKDADDEFKGRVERLRLRGLIFEEVWSDECPASHEPGMIGRFG
jgi:hypothetical protein